MAVLAGGWAATRRFGVRPRTARVIDAENGSLDGRHLNDQKDHRLPERTPMAEAIAGAAEAKSQVAALKAAIERAQNLTWDGRRKLEAAQKAIAAAKNDDAAALAESLISGGSTAPQAVRSARGRSRSDRRLGGGAQRGRAAGGDLKQARRRPNGRPEAFARSSLRC